MKYVTTPFILAVGLLTPLLSASSSPSTPDENVIQPSYEGWISGLHGRWSIEKPEMLGARNRGGEKVWATFLGFEIPEDLTESASLKLQLTGPRNHPQTFFLYGILGIEWSAETLQGKDAPGWDPDANDVAEAAIFLAAFDNPAGSDLIELGDTKEMAEFLKTNAGDSVTFIIVASDGSTSFYSTEGNPEKGPELVLSE